MGDRESRLHEQAGLPEPPWPPVPLEEQCGEELFNLGEVFGRCNLRREHGGDYHATIAYGYSEIP